MQRFISATLLLYVALTPLNPVFGDEKQPVELEDERILELLSEPAFRSGVLRGFRGGLKSRTLTDKTLKRFEKAKLTDEQKAAIEDLAFEFFDPIVVQEMKAELTPKQEAARVIARKEATMAGKKGKEQEAATAKAVVLTRDQQSAKAKVEKLEAAFARKTFDLLTVEQKRAIKSAKRPEPREKLDLMLQMGHDGELNSVAYNSDGRLLLTGSNDHTAILWETATGKQLRTFRGHKSNVSAVAFSADSKQVLTGSHDDTAILWETATGKKLQTLRGHVHWLTCATFSPDGRQVLAGAEYGKAILWDAASGKKLRTLHAPSILASLTSVVFSPDGQQVLAGLDKHTAILWETATGKRLQTFSGHRHSVRDVAFSPDGRLVLTGSSDETAIVWEAATGKKKQTFQGHTESVVSVAFSPDGRQLLTGSADKTAILWDTSTG